MKRYLLALFVCTLGIAFGSPAYSAASSSREILEPVRPQTIQLGGFWQQQAKRLTEKWLPHCIRQMEKGGRGQELLNLVALGKVNRGEPPAWKYTGLPWSDAYVYNTVEAICMALAVAPGQDAELQRAQAHLRAKLEEWVPIIIAAQDTNGYIHSFHGLNNHRHFSNIDWHEFYVMGYLLEMGVAHYRMTAGKDRRLYEAAVRCADHLNATFGPAPKRTWRNGHPGMEYALCRLGRLVNEAEGGGKGDKYILLSKHFLDHQHEGGRPNAYNQSDRPAIDMSEAKGHAVRATYFYTAMTDIALHLKDAAYDAAVDRIWTNAIQRKHYLTAGVGASHNGEAFAGDFELPNDGYCEVCAGCGLSFWSDRMHRLHGDAHYRDVQERLFYNNILGSIDLAGENFYYQNPLESDHPRYPWHGCPCCVGNVPRALFAIKDLIYSVNPARNELYLSHFVDSDATLPNIGGTSLRIRQETRYPWEGQIRVTLNPARKSEFTLKLRIPDRTESELYSAQPDLNTRYALRINGGIMSAKIERGYVAVRRSWEAGDRVELSLPIDVQRVHCDSRVAANRGRVALQRGPLVYNMESVDNANTYESFVLKPELALKSSWRESLLGGVMVLEGEGITAVPNFARLNRGGSSLVWMVGNPEEVARNLPKPPQNLPGFDGIQARSLDLVAIGDNRSEKQHRLQSQKSSSGQAFGHSWRHASDGGWFSYRLKVEPQGQHSVFITYWGGDTGNRRFAILANDKEIARQVLNANKPDQFFGVEYLLPEDLTRGKREINVKIAADPGATAGGIFDLRVLKGTRPL